MKAKARASKKDSNSLLLAQPLLTPATDYELQFIQLAQIVEPILEMKTEDMVNELAGVGLLVRHNPQFRREAAAILSVCRGMEVLKTLCLDRHRL